MSEPRKYAFSWDLLGDIDAGRPNLGKTARPEMYRLMLFCFRDVVESRHAAAAELFARVDAALYAAKAAGRDRVEMAA